jgi:hypothetical protein
MKLIWEFLNQLAWQFTPDSKNYFALMYKGGRKGPVHRIKMAWQSAKAQLVYDSAHGSLGA